ncbi:MAG TPA: MFS transporter [Solirubrobacterales bacterium]|jgi:MFS family permease|nr:MFS transporter [Solirubrobacterales bacterium]
MRRLLILASAMVFFDVVFFSAIAPLLPDYVAELGLSKAQAGVLSASYAAGTLVFSLPAGLLAARLGPRRTVIGGLLLLGLASVAFGFAHRFLLLDAARFTQGGAGALIWSGALTWLISVSPPERRGSVIGTALGTAVAGALLGPALGALAAEIGTEPVFSAVLGVAIALAFFAARLPEAEAPERQDLREVAETILSRPILIATTFVAIPSVMFGAVEVLVPLQIADLGGGHALIAGGFIAGAALEAVLAPIAGRYSDRVGRRMPFMVGLSICAVAMAAVALGQSMGVVMSGLILTSLGGGICFTPALTMLSEMAESSRLHQGFAAGLSNMAWAAGQVVGGLAAGGAASVAGNAVPSLAIIALLLGTVLYSFHALAPPSMRAVEG